MPDISMCMNHKCPSREQCYRYRAIPDRHWQSCGGFTVDEGRKLCAHFAVIYPSDRLAPMPKGEAT